MIQDFKSLEQILDALPVLQRDAEGLRETLLANLIMLSEIPAPTFEESARINLLTQRMLECGLQNVSTDESENGVGILPGTDSKRNILIVAHADTVHSSKADHSLSVLSDEIIGPGVADNGLGLAVIATLPTLLERLNIKLEANLILLGSTKGLGRGNLEGLHFFLQNNKLPIEAGICVEGAQIGRLSYTAQGMFRGEIECSLPEELDWQRVGDSSAIIALNDVVNRILEIPIPRRPKTTIVLGSMRGGKSYNVMATQSQLRFEVRSECADMVAQIQTRIHDIIADISSKYNAKIDFRIVASRDPGGISIDHPLVRHSRKIMQSLGLTPKISPSMSEVTELISTGIPALTVGITEVNHLHNLNETVRIEPIHTGIAQLLGILIAIDRGLCNESE